MRKLYQPSMAKLLNQVWNDSTVLAFLEFHRRWPLVLTFSVICLEVWLSTSTDLVHAIQSTHVSPGCLNKHTSTSCGKCSDDAHKWQSAESLHPIFSLIS